MRHRYIVLHAGKGIGWVHAENPMEAIGRIAAITGKPADECEALLFEVRRPKGRGINGLE